MRLLESDALIWKRMRLSNWAHGTAFEGAFDGDGGMSDQRMVWMVVGGAPEEELRELLVRLGGFSFVVFAEGEIVFLLLRREAVLQAEEKKIDRRSCLRYRCPAAP